MGARTGSGTALYRDLGDAIPGGHSLVFDAEAGAGLVAERYAQFCSDKARQWIARDVATIETRESNLPWSWECIARGRTKRHVCRFLGTVPDWHRPARPGDRAPTDE
jgi:hypothetical protein